MNSKHLLSMFVLLSCLIFGAYKKTEKTQNRTIQSSDDTKSIVREIAVGGGH